jgi:hypothetical protein
MEKLTLRFRNSSIQSITVSKMDVPCCRVIAMAARQALSASGKNIPYKEVTVDIMVELKG